MEAASKKKRGRPRVLSADLLAKFRAMPGIGIKTDRSLQNHHYAIRALEVLGVFNNEGRDSAPPSALRRWRFLLRDATLERARWDLLAALGRIEDQPTLIKLAAWACKQGDAGATVKTLVRALRRPRDWFAWRSAIRRGDIPDPTKVLG